MKTFTKLFSISTVLLLTFFSATAQTAPNNDFCSETTFLITDSAGKNPPNLEAVPNNFRTTDKPPAVSAINLTGLANLHIFGSAIFTPQMLANVLQQYPNIKYVIDLRKESHGYVGSNVVSWWGNPGDWGNLCSTPDQVEQDQQSKLAELATHIGSTVDSTVKQKIDDQGYLQITPQTLEVVAPIQSEKNLVKSFNINYQRFYISDHRAPVDSEVDRFVQFITQNVNPSDGLYFHCRGGDGRTTTFMIMYDMMRNANAVSFNDLIARQKILGGIDVSDIAHAKLYEATYAQQRYDFLKSFYTYCQQNIANNFQMTWSDWKASH